MTEPTVLVSSSIRSEILIEQPVEEVWDCVFQFPEWAPTVAKADLISGHWDQEGCLMLLTKKEWVGLQPFYSELIRSIPFDQQVYHNYTKDGDQLNGYVDLTFSQEQRSTRVIYSNYLTIRFSKQDKTYANPDGNVAKREDFQNDKAADQIVEIYLGPLKHYAESRATRRASST